MSTPARPWTVTPHGPLEQQDVDLWTLSSAVPTIPNLSRTMHVVKRRDGSLLFHNAVPMDDATRRQLEGLGRFGLLVLPTDSHALDGPAFAARLQVPAYAPGAARAALEPLQPIAGDAEALPADDAVRFIPLGGVKNGEGVLEVKSLSGKTHLLFCDAVMNTGKIPGVMGFFIQLFMGMGEGPRCIRFFRRRVGTSMAALADSFDALAKTPNLASLQVSHGTPVTADPAGVLRSIAAGLR